ncbi:GNAT family N-acetyltransferase [Metabacillus arenae]|uniref:GNAT family N-acetyltransferase n=1 Tax=Metabacillus arenae TaxID=2771434 RepID=A0A926NIB3_9BACI|nr:GNAT family N-acetyltransferase [Metabacillus arenae]MBD1381580.1 GNAT family N-acetyltransferase [Metabacillus arenae]
MFTIRKATRNDCQGIAKVHVDSWKTTYKGVVVQNYLDSLSYEQKERQWEQADLNFLFVAVNHSNDIVGFVSYGPERTKNYNIGGEIYAIYILEEYQGHGIGKALTLHAVEDLLIHGYKRMMVWVLEENRNKGFYQYYLPHEIAESSFTIGNRQHIEVAYGWNDLNLLYQRLSAKGAREING